MKLILVLPSQANQYSNLYEVFADLNSGLTSIGIESKIVEVKMSGDAVYPFGSVESRANIDYALKQNYHVLSGGPHTSSNVIAWISKYEDSMIEKRENIMDNVV